MRILKHILAYFIWTIISFLSALGYTRMILGPKPEPSTGFIKMFDWIYDFVMIRLVPIIGIIIAVLFIVIDVFYLKKKLKNNLKGTIIRFLSIILLTLVVGATHYLLEKVIDVI